MKMRKVNVLLLAAVFTVGYFSLANVSFAQIDTDSLINYVNPLIGTANGGNVYPGPTTPHGMVQLGPDTDMRNWSDGYDYGDSIIIGFSLQHLSGTGIPDLGDFAFVPSVGEMKFVPGMETIKMPDGSSRDTFNPDSGYCQPFSHKDEVAKVGYYSVRLPKYGVLVELAATPHAGIMKFTFPKTDSANVMVDLSHVLQWKVVWSRVRRLSKTLVTGFHLVNGWAKERYLYFAAEYSRPYDNFGIMMDGKRVVYNTYRFRSAYEAAGPDLQYFMTYNTEKDPVVMVKVGISAVSSENALANLKAEIPGWDFDKVVRDARAEWSSEMRKVTIEGSTAEKQTFYTALYHTQLDPTIYNDVNGEYRGLDQNIHVAKGFTKYSIFSLWDTFRAEHPLMVLIHPHEDADMIKSMLAHYDQSVEHLLPVWSLYNNETWCMIGYHAVPVIADAIMKGVRGFDYERAYDAMKATAMNPHYDSVKEYAEIGYVPYNHEDESVSKTLEYAYDDYCIAQVAKKFGREKDFAYFMKRAMSYRNLFDPSTKLMRAKDSDGRWITPFDPNGYNPTITEGTNWQYTWFVPQDVQGLINLMGGKRDFATKLDTLFMPNKSVENFGGNSGQIGEYWHGNEPSHHITYLYDYAGEPWKTQKLVREVETKFYYNKPDGLCGNDDCGQMSAWYVFSTIGFYPVCPGDNYYVIGTPGAEEAAIQIGNGNVFRMKAIDFSAENKYIQSVTLNGKSWDKTYIPFEDVVNGGELIFRMGNKPNKSWGTAADSAPPSVSKSE
jgi:predicted alpha-1,2-mannosidase